MTKSNGIKSLKQAAKLLNRHAPDGESLAYINPDEGRLLKAHGGSGIMTLQGVPSYNWFTDAAGWVKDQVVEYAPKVYEWLGYGKQPAGKDDEGKPVYTEGRSIVNDALSVWGALRAKKDQEGLNAAEMEQFNKLNQQLAAAETEFDVGSDFGAQLKPEYVTTPKAVTRDIDFSGQSTPDLTIDAKAYGGRIGAFNGGIQGLMPQQGMPQQGMPQQGLDPRMGYQMGSPHGVEKFDLANLDSLEGLRDPFLPSDEMKEIHKDYDIESMSDPFKTSGEMQEIQKDYDIESMRDPFKPSEIQKLVQEIMKLYENIEVKDAIALATKMLRENQITGQAQGGRIGAQGGGIMPLLDMGGMEKDYRQDGGFVPIGRREKADDVPARLSKNEFVFTADAVKAAGGGDIDEGAQRMYNVMKNLEAGGDISEQSQGQG